jgi:glucans biosynthesis protein C
MVANVADNVVKRGMPTDAIPPAVPAVSSSPRTRPRLDFVDNLRWVMIVLVVSMHAAVTYSHVGSWYFMEDPKPSTPVLAIFATYQIFLQAFFMGLLFFLAGYFVPGALSRRGVSGFVRERLVRLGLPSLFFMLVVQPLTVFCLLPGNNGHPKPSLLEVYPAYITRGRFLSGSGPMWFAVALLLFSLIYAASGAFNRAPLAKKEHSYWIPNDRHILVAVFCIGTCSFLVRLVQPMGTNILNMQLCFFSQYVFLFIAGTVAWQNDWLMRIPYSFGLRWLRLALTLGSAGWLALLFALLSTHTEDRLSGGFTWQSAAFSFWEAFFCVGVCLGLIVLFREKMNHQGAFRRWLSDNCFAVYLFHTPLLIAVTLMLRDFHAPKLVKFPCATLLGLVVTYLASSLIFRRFPLLKRIL